MKVKKPSLLQQRGLLCTASSTNYYSFFLIYYLNVSNHDQA
ncbi:hypothetical protein [Limosilactobacillus gastricus]|nr:hypothetical protein [Limosilactobacillus gastricus]